MGLDHLSQFTHGGNAATTDALFIDDEGRRGHDSVIEVGGGIGDFYHLCLHVQPSDYLSCEVFQLFAIRTSWTEDFECFHGGMMAFLERQRSAWVAEHWSPSAPVTSDFHLIQCPVLVIEQDPEIPGESEEEVVHLTLGDIFLENPEDGLNCLDAVILVDEVINVISPGGMVCLLMCIVHLGDKIIPVTHPALRAPDSPAIHVDGLDRHWELADELHRFFRSRLLPEDVES